MSEAVSSVHQEIAALKEDVAALKLEMNDKLNSLDTEVRIVKHDFIAIKDLINATAHRMDRMEERLGAKIEALGDRLTGLNLKQERGLGFFAGMTSVFTIAGGFLLAVGKLLFGGP